MLSCAICGVCVGALSVGPALPRIIPTALAARDGAIVARSESNHVPVVRSTILRDRDGLFRMKAVIEGTALNLIVDTGATTTVLTGADAARIGLHADRTDTITTAAGPSAMQWARARQVRIAGVTVADTDVAIIEHGLATSLLGQNMLDRLGPLTIDGDTISFGTNG